MNKKLIGLGLKNFPFESEHIKLCWEHEHSSLMDGDIVVLSSCLFGTYGHFEYVVQWQYFEHWRREVRKAIESGKTLFVFCEAPIVLGRQEWLEHSQSYRSVNFDFFHDILGLTTLCYEVTSGDEIKYYSNKSVLRPLWSICGKCFRYEINFGNECPGLTPYFKPYAANNILGGIIKTNSGGHIVLLPAINFDSFKSEEFDSRIHDEDVDEWDASAFDFSKMLIGQLVSIDKALRNSRESSPIPDWVTNTPSLKIPSLDKDKEELCDITNQFEERKVVLEKKIEQGKIPHRLLYETGPLLEESIRECLQILGFHCKQYCDEDSEFDVIFSSDEGEGLGEITGSSKQIDIKKLRQLITNDGEYLEKMGTPIKNVLFGNGLLLKKIEERKEQFTNDCIVKASRSDIALVNTSDLFFIYQYLLENNDKDFAKDCRQTILKGKGIVSFPSIPKLKKQGFHA